MVKQARKGTLEFLLTNHPLDCPVCDKGGECELQDMVFRYGAGESRFTERKVHVDEKQWSPVVFFDAPRCILCYRCVRVCNEGMGVNALGVANRGVIAEIVPNHHDHLECDECGACIDICPVGALTSGTYRYQTRPWEMDHVGTICTHCADGCRTTLGVRNDKIIRGNNRDRSGINGEFLCIKGRYGFDFTEHPERLQSPHAASGRRSLSRSPGRRPWRLSAEKFTRGQGARRASSASSARTTPPTKRIFSCRSSRGRGSAPRISTIIAPAIWRRFSTRLSGRERRAGDHGGSLQRKAVLVVASDLSQQHPFLAFPDPRQCAGIMRRTFTR